MKRTKKNRQADCLQTGKSERTAASAAKCTTDYDQENTGVDFRKDKGRDKPLSTFLQDDRKSKVAKSRAYYKI